VGREAELSKLDACLAQAQTGDSRFVSLIGDPGIGKSALGLRFCDQARERGARVVVSRCQENRAAQPFGAWIQTLRNLDADGFSEPLSALLKRDQQPQEGNDEINPRPDQHSTRDADESRVRLFDEIVDLLKARTADQTLVCFFEDIHWADKASLLLLHFVARELVEASLLLVVSHRPSAIYDAKPFLQSMRSWQREPIHEQIQVKGLNDSDAETVLKHVGGDAVPPAVVQHLLRECEGNPFFVRETIRNHLEHSNSSFGEPSDPADVEGVRKPPLPENVSQVILQRVNRLPSETAKHLFTGSVLGDAFDLATLASVEQEDGTKPLELAVIARELDSACTVGLAQSIPNSLGRYRFEHSLIRESLYQAMEPERRRRLHRDAVIALESAPDTHLNELAHHSYESALSDRGSKALLYNYSAAQRAEKMLAYDEAKIFYGRALEAQRLYAPEDRQTIAFLLLQLATVQFLGGEREAAYEGIRQAAQLARDLQDRTLLGWTALASVPPWNFTAPADERTIAILEAALKDAPEDEDRLFVSLAARLAGELRGSSRHQEATELVRTAIERARKSGDKELLASACTAVRFGIWGPDNLEERLAIAIEGLEVARSIDSLGLQATGHLWRFVDLLEAARWTEAQAEIDYIHESARSSRSPFFRWQSLTVEAMQLLLRGEFAAAEETAQKALALGVSTIIDEALLHYAVFTFQITRLRGSIPKLQEQLSAVISAFPALPQLALGLAIVDLESGNPDLARERFEVFMSKGFESISRDALYITTMSIASGVVVGLKDTERAKQFYRLMLPFSGRLVVIGNGAACYGAVDSLLGSLAAVAGDDEAAAVHFERGLATETSIGATPLATQTRFTWASWLAASDPARARELLTRVAHDAGQLGMASVLESAKAAIGGLGEPRKAAASVDERKASTAARGLIRRSGDYWTLGFEDQELQLRDSKGLSYLAYLLLHPHRDVAALELMALTDPPEGSVHQDRTDSESDHDDAAPTLDPSAASSYRRRAEALREQLEEAEADNDAGRQEVLRREIDFLAGELSRGFGLGGRPRRAGSRLERSRLNVTRAIQRVTRKLEQEHPRLGRHLSRAIRTGNFCSYEPDADRPVTWQA
jgi:predicted ATPase